MAELNKQALPKLERLNIRFKASKTLPAGITNSRKLKKLDIRTAKHLSGFPNETDQLETIG